MRQSDGWMAKELNRKAEEDFSKEEDWRNSLLDCTVEYAGYQPLFEKLTVWS